MKRSVLALIIVLAPSVDAAAQVVAPSPNGIEFPSGYQDWRVISISHRVDNNTLRVIYGNDVAVQAAREGKTNPWPDGSVLGKVVWKEAAKAAWPKAIAPDSFVHAEFMFRDAVKYADNGTGWGWARWVGLNQEPFEKGAQVCTSCHTPVKERDWVFTDPASLP